LESWLALSFSPLRLSSSYFDADWALISPNFFSDFGSLLIRSSVLFAFIFCPNDQQNGFHAAKTPSRHRPDRSPAAQHSHPYESVLSFRLEAPTAPTSIQDLLACPEVIQ
jgi:hypothetical protein